MVTNKVLENLTVTELGDLAETYAFLAVVMDNYGLEKEAERARAALIKIFNHVPEASTSTSTHCCKNNQYVSTRIIYKQAGTVRYLPSGIVDASKDYYHFSFFLQSWEPKNKRLIDKVEKDNSLSRQQCDLLPDTVEEAVKQQIEENAVSLKRQLKSWNVTCLRYQITKAQGKKFYTPRIFKEPLYLQIQILKKALENLTTEQYNTYVLVNKTWLHDIREKFELLFNSYSWYNNSSTDINIIYFADPKKLEMTLKTNSLRYPISNPSGYQQYATYYEELRPKIRTKVPKHLQKDQIREYLMLKIISIWDYLDTHRDEWPPFTECLEALYILPKGE